MHYNISLGVAIIQCGDGDGVGILEPVEDGDEVEFLILVGYG